jgi:tripartite-type tricarboxylate transporter receptor subunit TctC
MDRRTALKLYLSASALAGLGIRPGYAQPLPYPSRPLRVVVPFPPGGPYDAIARPLAQKLGNIMGQTVIVENRSGGETSIGAAYVAKSDPDGYTILVGGSTTHVFAPAELAVPYHPINDFIDLAVICTLPVCIAVSAKSPFKTLADLIAYAKANPGKLNYADSASSVRLGVEVLKKVMGLDIVGIPYRGAAPAIIDLFAGILQVYPGSSGAVAKHHADGTMRALAVLSDKRVPAMPDVPTAAEAGAPGVVMVSFSLLSVRAGTPAPIVETLYRAVHKVLDDDAFVKYQITLGVQPIRDSTPDSARKFVREQIQFLTPLIRSIKSA